MKILFIFLLLFVLYIVYLIKSNDISIDFKSFFKKGFKKLDNQFGLFCYTGKQGKGKTYSCVNFCVKQKKANGYIIITNVHSFKYFNDTIFVDNILDIIQIAEQMTKEEKKIMIFYDEIFTVLEKKTPMKKEILAFLSQLRKRKILFVTTAQEWSEINITFRRYVRYQVDCNMFPFPLTKTAFIFNSINDGDLMKWNNDLQDFIAPRISANFAKCSLDVINSYDTFETIKTN